MNGRRAKAIRREIYGDLVTSPKGRRYSNYSEEKRFTLVRMVKIARRLFKSKAGTGRMLVSGRGGISAGEKRREYQAAKRRHKMNWREEVKKMEAKEASSNPFQKAVQETVMSSLEREATELRQKARRAQVWVWVAITAAVVAVLLALIALFP